MKMPLSLVHPARPPETPRPFHGALFEIALSFFRLRGARLREYVARPNYTAATFEAAGKRFRVLITEEPT